MKEKDREPNSISKKREPNPNSDSYAKYNADKDPTPKAVFKETYFDVQRNDSSYREQDSEINLESLITAPMVAVSKANATMLSGQVQFILDYCFKKTIYTLNSKESAISNEKDCYEAIMVNLVVQRPNLQESDTSIKQAYLDSIIPIPILTLLPINSLGIDKMKVDFSMDITSITSKKDGSKNPQERKAQLSGKLAGDKRDAKNSSSMKSLTVYVEASKLPLPNGLLNIIDLYSKI